MRQDRQHDPALVHGKPTAAMLILGGGIFGLCYYYYYYFLSAHPPPPHVTSGRKDTKRQGRGGGEPWQRPAVRDTRKHRGGGLGGEDKKGGGKEAWERETCALN